MASSNTPKGKITSDHGLLKGEIGVAVERIICVLGRQMIEDAKAGGYGVGSLTEGQILAAVFPDCGVDPDVIMDYIFARSEELLYEEVGRNFKDELALKDIDRAVMDGAFVPVNK